MPTVPEAHSIAYLAIELGRDRNALGKALAAVKPDRIQGDRQFYLMKTVVDKLVNGSASKVKMAKDEAEHRLKDVKGELLEMELKEKQGRLVSIEEVQKVLGDVLSAVRSRMLAIPSRLGQRLASTKQPAKAKGIVEKAVRGALEEVSQFDPSNLKLKKSK